MDDSFNSLRRLRAKLLGLILRLKISISCALTRQKKNLMPVWKNMSKMEEHEDGLIHAIEEERNEEKL